jgi:thiopeptide-type bacteriocin biosynthesis protein
MKVNPLNKVICRTPAFSMNASLQSVFPILKLKIKESSPAFFELIEPFESEDLHQLNEKARFTLWKYFNRARYRSTPFGSFAAISMLPLAEQERRKIVISSSMEPIHFIDWGQKEYYLNTARQHIGPYTSFLSNSSLYFTGNEIRYLKIKDNFHELATVNAIPELNALLVTCKRKTESSIIYELMRVTFDMDFDSTTALLMQLMDMQLIFSEQFPNITGEDYFERIKIQTTKSPNDYIITNRKLISGSFDGQLLQQFPAMIKYLAQQFGTYGTADLDNFKQAFLKRFEHQEMSLALIMDPEIGIGYGNLAQQHNANALVDEIKQARTTNNAATIEYGPLHAFLLNKIVAGKAIALEEFKVITKSKPTRLPNTFSFIFHLFESKPVIAHAGGCTANSLIGRFTLANEEVETYAKEITQIETEANPGVAFFDIAYQAETRVDNVNRRKSLYPYELPILTWTNTSMPLDLNDIMVSVLSDEVVLKSKKLGKRIMPRIPSAYNYTRSDLAVYRFLCDIQSQGLATQLTFRLQDFFPKLEFYPRVSFHQIILSPAMWLLPTKRYNLKAEASKQMENLKAWLEEKKINFKFRSGYADSTLCFDPKETEDLVAFLNFCKQQQGDIYITEALISEGDCISDENGGLYLPQYIVNFHHHQTLYQPISLQQNTPKTSHVQLPGGDWLYFELYSHALKGNSILLNQIQKFIKMHQKLLKKWFFIRYNQPTAHLRLRLHLKRKTDGFKIIEALRVIIEPEMQLGSITDFKIKTYFRETHRYGAKRINLVEQFFLVDSKCVLFLLFKAKSEDQLVMTSLNLILGWLNIWLPETNDQINFVHFMANEFDSEMQIGPDHFKKINANFNELKRNLQQLTLPIADSTLKKYKQIITAILSTCNGVSEERKLIADLIHMHVNRLFSVDQRMYETVVYHYLLRMLQIKRAITKI